MQSPRHLLKAPAGLTAPFLGHLTICPTRRNVVVSNEKKTSVAPAAASFHPLANERRAHVYPRS
jgi:hypothetical protein